MIEITETGVWGFKGAIRGMRNPYMSHEKSDSRWVLDCENCEDVERAGRCEYRFGIGNNDMTLAKKLINGGSEHRKFLRMIHVQADVLAPLYWWKEYDTYKVATVANSSSTMHTIHKRLLTIDDFSHDDLSEDGLACLKSVMADVNALIIDYAKVEGGMMEENFRSIINILPSSFNQLRTIDTNYECLLSIHHQRKNHRLSEWRSFCNWIEELPYMKDFIGAIK